MEKLNPVLSESSLFQNLISQSLDEELPTLTLPIIKGTIPAWLDGTLVRNGPAKFETGKERVPHWFDGLAMLHAFSFRDGKVEYCNRFLRTKAYHEVFHHHSLNFQGFAIDPCRSLFKRLFTFFFSHQGIPNANINVAKYADAYVALTEIPLPVEFDIKTMETKGLLHFADNLPQSFCWESAHPHLNGTKEGTYNYLLKFGMKSCYILYRLLPETNIRETIAEIPSQTPSYMHSFSITEHYAILTEYPFIIDPRDLLFKNRPFIENYRWDPSRDTFFLVIEKSTGRLVGRYPAPAFFAFHHINAYEKEENIILDIITYPDSSIIDCLRDYGMGKENPSFPLPEMKRFTVNLKSSVIEVSSLADCCIELPRIHAEKYDGKPYRYAYGVDLREAFSLKDSPGIYKVNVDTHHTQSWLEEGCSPGEPVFVANKLSEKEDGGVILSLVLDNRIRKSFLLVLDAETFQEIGRAEVPHPVPQGLHGQFFTF